MLLEKLTRRRPVAVKLGEAPVASGVIVVHIDHDLAADAAGRELSVAAEGNGDDDEIPERRSLLGRHRSGAWAELGYEGFERVGPA